MKDLFFRIIVVIAIIYMIIDITQNIIIDKRYIDISKTDSNELLRDYNKFYILKGVIDSYNKYILEGKYSELSNITLFNGKKDNNFYNELKNKSSLSASSVIKINEIKVLSDDVFKCNYLVISGNKTTDLSIVVKLDMQKSSFKIINVQI
jgi:hypothetical protein